MIISSSGILISAANKGQPVKVPPKNTELTRAEMLVNRADALIELYKKDGRGSIAQIEALINEARGLTGSCIIEKITLASQKLELIKIAEKIKSGISKLEEARKGCKRIGTENFKSMGIAAIEESKKSLLDVLGSSHNASIKKSALFLYLVTLSKQDYGEDAAQKEAFRILNAWELQSRSGKPFSVAVIVNGAEKEFTGIELLDKKDINIFELLEIIRIKKLLNEASLKDTLNKFSESEKKLNEAKYLASKIVLGSHSKAIKKEAVILFITALFRLGDKTLDEGLKLSRQWIKGGFNGATRADGGNKSKIENDGSFALIAEDLDISAIMALADISDQINSGHSGISALNILDAEEEPFIKKQVLYLYCKALYLQGTKQSMDKAQQIYSEWDSDKFDGTIEIEGKKYSFIEKIDKSKDSHISGAIAVIQLKSLVVQGRFREAEVLGSKFLEGNYIPSVKDDIRSFFIKAKAENDKAASSPNKNDHAQDSTDEQSLDDLYKIAEIKKDIFDKNYDGATSAIHMILEVSNKPNLKKQALASYLDMLLRKSKKDTIKEAAIIYQAWIDASKSEDKTVSITIGSKTYIGIQKIFLDKADDSYIIAGSFISKIKELIEDKNIEEAKNSALKFLDTLEKENPYEDYVKTQAMVSYLEALLRNTSKDSLQNKESLQNAENIINAWGKSDFKGDIQIGSKTYHNIPSLGRKDSALLFANLYRQIGITHIIDSDFEGAVNFFKKAEDADPEDATSYIYSARSLFSADGLRSDQEYQDKYKKAIKLINDRLPSEIKNNITLQNILHNDPDKFKLLFSNADARFMALLVLEYNIKLALTNGEDIKADNFSRIEKALFNKWMNDKISVSNDYIFKSQIHYDSAEIYRNQQKYSDARKEYESIIEIDGSSWWLDRQISLLSPNSFGMNTNISQSSVSPELFFRTYAPLGPVSTQEIYLSITPKLNASSSLSLDNSFTERASIFLDNEKLKILKNHINLSSGGKMDIGFGYKQSSIFLDNLSLGGGISYISDGNQEKLIKTNISSDLQVNKFLSLGLSGDLNFHIGPRPAVTPNLRFISHASRKIFNNLSVFFDGQLAYGQKYQNEYGWKSIYSSLNGDSKEIKEWLWREDNASSVSYTRSSTDSPNSESFWRQYYWISENANSGGVSKKIWHIGTALTTETKEVMVPINNPVNSDEKIPIHLKSINQIGFARKEGNSIIYGANNSISTGSDSRPLGSDIDMIDISKLVPDPKRPSVQIYAENYSTKNVNGETVIIVTSKKASAALGESWPSQYHEQQTYRIRAVHNKLPDGQMKLTLYGLDLIKHGDIAIPPSNDKLPQEEILYTGEGVKNTGAIIQHSISETLSAGLELETSVGIFGFKPFVQANQFIGTKTLTSAPDNNYYSLGLSLYGKSVPLVKLPYGSISGDLTVRYNQFHSESSIETNGLVGYTYGF